MAPLPTTRALLESEGYKRMSYTRCQGCKSPMEMWVNPAGRYMPFDPMPQPESVVVAHFATCPNAADFRKSKKR